MDGFFLVNCSMTGKTLSCHWSSKIRLLWWHTLNWVGGGTPAHYLQPLGFLKSCIFISIKDFWVALTPVPPDKPKLGPNLAQSQFNVCLVLLLCIHDFVDNSRACSRKGSDQFYPPPVFLVYSGVGLWVC